MCVRGSAKSSVDKYVVKQIFVFKTDLYKGWIPYVKDMLIARENMNSQKIDLCLFSWGNVPGAHNGRLLRYLVDDIGIDWARSAKIRKSDDGKTIHIFRDVNSAEIIIHEVKENAILKISDGRIHSLKVKKENGKLNIYSDFIIQSYSDKENREELEKMARTSFEYTLNCPNSWLNIAWRLKRAADEINIYNLPGKGLWNFMQFPDRALENSLVKEHDTELIHLTPVYRFLMGQSFENLLKGIIIAQGTPAGSNGKLNKDFKSHNINMLLEKIDYTKCSITGEEEEILKEQQQYVKWAGRYPISTKAEDFTIVQAYSYDNNRKELELWKRLAEHLDKVGWANKCGTRVYKKSKKQAP
jgi:hypothetical protein